MALLKWVLKMCRQKKKRSSHLQRQNTGYEEVTSTRETSDSKPKCESMFQNKPIFQSETTTNIVHESVDENGNKTEEIVLESKSSENADNENHDTKQCEVEEKSLSEESGAQEQTTAIAANSDTLDKAIPDAAEETDQTLENENTDAGHSKENEELDENKGIDDKDKHDETETEDIAKEEQHDEIEAEIRDEKQDENFETNTEHFSKKEKSNETEAETRDEQQDENDRSDTESTNDEFADLVPNEGNYRGSSRTDLHYQNVPGEEECPPVTQNNADQKRPDSASRGEYFLNFIAV